MSGHFKTQVLEAMQDAPPRLGAKTCKISPKPSANSALPPKPKKSFERE